MWTSLFGRRRLRTVGHGLTKIHILIVMESGRSKLVVRDHIYRKWALTSNFERRLGCSVRNSVFGRQRPVLETLT